MAYSGARLALRNRKGRDTAREVELVVAIRDERADHLRPERTNIMFSSLVDGSEPRPVSTIPAGFERTAFLFAFGPSGLLRQQVLPNYRANFAGGDSQPAALLNAYPVPQDASHLIEYDPAEDEYPIEITAFGSNFDAVTFFGRFRIESDMDVETDGLLGPETGIAINWIDKPEVTEPAGRRAKISRRLRQRRHRTRMKREWKKARSRVR